MTIRKRKIAIGMMSGTSMDGVDAALVETDGTDIFELGPFLSIPYAPAFRSRLKTLMGRPSNGEDLDVERDLTLYHAEAVRDLIADSGLPANAVDIVGFHGQTIFHDPVNAVTCQLGDGPLLASKTEIDVVSDFRAADVAAGGEGAPLTPVFHVALAQDLERPLAILNMGGVANVTWISPDGGVIAFDTGPANAMVDDWIRARTDLNFDEGGAIARQGKVNDIALAALMENPYFDLPPPKSLDREAFDMGPVAYLSTEDGAATLSAFTAASIAEAQNLLPTPPLRWLATGGGRHNPTLMAAVRCQLAAPLEPVEAVGWNGDALEAQAFAYLAVRSIYGMPLSYPQTTGVRHPVTGGVFHAAYGT